MDGINVPQVFLTGTSSVINTIANGIGMATREVALTLVNAEQPHTFGNSQKSSLRAMDPWHAVEVILSVSGTATERKELSLQR